MLAQALCQLHVLGALSDDGAVTERGRIMSHFPVEPCVSRMLVEAADRHAPPHPPPPAHTPLSSQLKNSAVALPLSRASYLFVILCSVCHCLPEMACIAAMLSSEHVFVRAPPRSSSSSSSVVRKGEARERPSEPTPAEVPSMPQPALALSCDETLLPLV